MAAKLTNINKHMLFCKAKKFLLKKVLAYSFFCFQTLKCFQISRKCFESRTKGEGESGWKKTI